MMRPDLNDYVTFAEVVAHGGFTAAGRALREPKSKLSRRVSALEARLGVRLIERSSRRFRVTEVGQTFYERCRAMMLEAERAEALVAEAQAEPHGRIRMSCPRNLVKFASGIVRGFLDRYPKVQLQLVASDRAVDLIEERVDVALRVRHELTSDASLTMRSLGRLRGSMRCRGGRPGCCLLARSRLRGAHRCRQARSRLPGMAEPGRHRPYRLHDPPRPAARRPRPHRPLGEGIPGPVSAQSLPWTHGSCGVSTSAHSLLRSRR
jgi:DNA-binding transcriptional LysR family regulator